MTMHVNIEPSLTKNQALVFNELSQAKGPLSAYAILDHLRNDGFRAPLQVYRALEKLLELGMVHRLESLNAFVACSHPECETDTTVVFTICDPCGQVVEVADNKLRKQLKSLAGRNDFALEKSTVELRGTCKDCQAN